MEGHLPVVKYLVEDAKANANCETVGFDTPYALALSKGMKQVSDYLKNVAGVLPFVKSHVVKQVQDTRLRREAIAYEHGEGKEGPGGWARVGGGGGAAKDGGKGGGAGSGSGADVAAVGMGSREIGESYKQFSEYHQLAWSGQVSQDMADHDAFDVFRRTTLMMAAYRAQTLWVKAKLDLDPLLREPITKQDTEDWNALHWVCASVPPPPGGAKQAEARR